MLKSNMKNCIWNLTGDYQNEYFFENYRHLIFIIMGNSSTIPYVI